MVAVAQMVEALVVGVLAAFTLIYAFQTRVEYPAWMVRSFDHPWILLVCLLVSVLMFHISPLISAMIVILVVALWMDAIVFAQKPIHIKQPDGLMSLQSRGVGAESQPQQPQMWPYGSMEDSYQPQESGPSLESVSLEEPQYPTFFGDRLPPIGPAPFV